MSSDLEILDSRCRGGRSEREGGLPIDSVVVAPDGTIVVRSRNQSAQRGGEVLPTPSSKPCDH